jgi:hypothetical protein
MHDEVLLAGTAPVEYGLLTHQYVEASRRIFPNAHTFCSAMVSRAWGRWHLTNRSSCQTARSVGSPRYARSAAFGGTVLATNVSSVCQRPVAAGGSQLSSIR